MRSVFRSVLVALVVVVALSAIAASGASAHEFRVDGKGITGEEAFAGSGGTFHLNVVITGAEVSLECSKSTSKGNLHAAGELLSTIELKECRLTSPPHCKLPASEEKEIRFTVGSGQLVWVHEAEGLAGLEFKGERRNEELVSLSIEKPAGCALSAGSYVVTGHWVCDLHGAGVEAVEHEETCSEEESDLRLGGNGGTLEYSQKIKLTSGKNWSVV